MISKDSQFKAFRQLQEKRSASRQSIFITELALYLQNKILSENLRDYVKKKIHHTLPQQILHFLKNVSPAERVSIYNQTFSFLLNTRQLPEPIIQKHLFNGYLRSRKLKSWKKKLFQIEPQFEYVSMTGDNGKIKKFQLKNYMPRASKNTQKKAIAFQAYRSVKQSKKTVHIGFNDIQQLGKFTNVVRTICLREWLMLIFEQSGYSKSMLITSDKRIENQDEQSIKAKLRKAAQQMALQNELIQKTLHVYKQNKRQSTLINKQELKPAQQKPSITTPQKPVTAQNQPQSDSKSQQRAEKLQNKKSKMAEFEPRMDLAASLLPEYRFQDIKNEIGYLPVDLRQSLRILRSESEAHRYKIIVSLRGDPLKVLCLISNPFLLKSYNRQADQVLLKNKIAGDNSILIYQKRKNFGKTYRARDFIYLRHVCRRDQAYFIVDKSIQSVEHPPYYTIVRGHFDFVVYGVFKSEDKTLLIVDHKITNGGYITADQQQSMTLLYLRQFANIQSFIEQQLDYKNDLFNFDFDTQVDNQFHSMEDLDSGCNTQRIQISPIQQEKQSQLIEQPKVQYVKDIIQQVPEEDQSTVSQLKDVYQPVRLDEKGLAILDYRSLKRRYQTQPLTSCQRKLAPALKGHPVWRGEFYRSQTGGLLFHDTHKLQKQKRVLGFIIQRIARNLATGKSILNISLPVQIFSPFSNLELFAQSFALAPVQLEHAAQVKDPIRRMVEVTVFTIVSAVLYIQIQKPFNPILGETFQCFINGCPLYFQQVSHHPPIAAFMMYGRGYTLTGAMEAKIKLSLNSGCGSNDGQMKVVFNDGDSYHIVLGGGQLSGLITGQRKLNLTGRILVYNPKQGLICDLQFNPNNRGMFSYGSREHPIDQIEGQLLSVNPDFLSNYRKSKYPSPKKSQILSRHGKVHGIYNQKIFFNDQLMFDFDAANQLQLQHQPIPLPSDANYREDIIYRKMQDMIRAQNEKERLEVIQRKDRDLRKTYGPSKSH